MIILDKSKYFKGLMRKIFLASILCIILSLSIGCSSGIREVYSPNELVLVLEEAGWTPLPFADSKMQPGSIVKVDEENIVWIDDISSCRYPLTEFQEKGNIPNVTFEKDVVFGANALINIKGITAGPDFKKIKKIHLEINDQGADALRLLKLRVWLEDTDNQDKVSKACTDELSKSDRYLITEAFRISNGKYTLYDSLGTAIEVKTGEIGDLLQFDPDVNYRVTANGSLEIERPVYFAVRKVISVGYNFQTPRDIDSTTETADEKIKQIFLKESDKQ